MATRGEGLIKEILPGEYSLLCNSEVQMAGFINTSPRA
jgi:hypothetical protein